MYFFLLLRTDPLACHSFPRVGVHFSSLLRPHFDSTEVRASHLISFYRLQARKAVHNQQQHNIHIP